MNSEYQTPPIQTLLNAIYWYKIFDIDSAVFEVRDMQWMIVKCKSWL